MAYRGKSPADGFNTQLDAGLGLIFRLNFLWKEADRFALDGDLDKWSYVLDRIFCNLSYRGQMDILIDENDNIKSIKLVKKDEEIFRRLQEDVKLVKLRKTNALKQKSTSQYNQYQNDHYDVLMIKDIWLRKMMHELGLYLKEADKNPALAMFGGG